MMTNPGQDLRAVPRFIFASGRGGSTWVQDALAHANGIPTLFEPFHKDRVEGGGRFAFQFVLPDEENEALKDFLDTVMFAGHGKLWCQYRINLDHLWHGSSVFTSPGRLKRQFCKYIDMAQKIVRYRNFPPGPFVLKFIRANLMIGWLKKAYDAPCFVLLRHPGAVVESKKRLPQWTWENALGKLYADQALRTECLGDMDLPDMNGLSRVSGFALQWCLETKVALMQAAQCDIPVIAYEHLVAEPEIEWRRAADALGLAEVPDREMLARPSQQAAEAMQDRAYDLSFLSRWERRLPDRDKDVVQRLLDQFGLDVYSMASPLPREKRNTVQSRKEVKSGTAV